MQASEEGVGLDMPEMRVGEECKIKDGKEERRKVIRTGYLLFSILTPYRKNCRKKKKKLHFSFRKPNPPHPYQFLYPFRLYPRPLRRRYHYPHHLIHRTQLLSLISSFAGELVLSLGLAFGRRWNLWGLSLVEVKDKLF